MTASEREMYREIVGRMNESDLQEETRDALQVFDIAVRVVNEKLHRLHDGKLKIVWHFDVDTMNGKVKS